MNPSPVGSAQARAGASQWPKTRWVPRRLMSRDTLLRWVQQDRGPSQPSPYPTFCTANPAGWGKHRSPRTSMNSGLFIRPDGPVAPMAECPEAEGSQGCIRGAVKLSATTHPSEPYPLPSGR